MAIALADDLTTTVDELRALITESNSLIAALANHGVYVDLSLVSSQRIQDRRKIYRVSVDAAYKVL